MANPTVPEVVPAVEAVSDPLEPPELEPVVMLMAPPLKAPLVLAPALRTMLPPAPPDAEPTTCHSRGRQGAGRSGGMRQTNQAPAVVWV